ncbi:MAG: 16S rRNA (guanine(966)-N(2))-methyltransferase RsmD [Elusimicrobiales bacterium]|nr:16S rRNA (guanine(966)-N(2))-methyltransferase RsmD [Elusimicrobiales bacterium]
MRIIAGSAKGRKLISVKQHLPVKPISDRIKQSLFDIIKPRLPASRFLDLFAGTGAVGLEALSRGAELAVFVERDQACLKAINRNLEHLGFAARAKVLRADVMAGLAWLRHYAGADGAGYDMIFLGTPYRDAKNRMLALTGPVLEFIASGGLLAPDGRIVAQHHITEKFALPSGYEAYRAEKYGDSLVTFVKRAQGAPLVPPSAVAGPSDAAVHYPPGRERYGGAARQLRSHNRRGNKK